MTAPESVELRRSVSMIGMALFGLGTIVGAGIYVLIGEIAADAGSWAPLSFLVAAVVASLTGLSYSELVSRHPRSAGEAVYVNAAFGRPWLATAVGWAVVGTGLVSAATLSRGFAGYLHELTGLVDWAGICLLIVVVTGLAIWGVRQSVSVAVGVTVIEVAGLLLVVIATSPQWVDPANWQRWQEGLEPVPWLGMAGGAFLAFYAFIGFEDMVNMAEEVRDVRRAMPRAIMIAIVASTLIYLAVATVAVVAVDPQVLGGTDAPVSALVADSSWLSPTTMTVVSLLAIVNGVVVQMLMGPRVIYGLTRGNAARNPLGRLWGPTRTPAWATLLVAVVVLAFALTMPLSRLAQITSALILVVFTVVNLGLIRLQRAEPHDGYRVPRWVPFAGAATCALLLVAQVALDVG